ncbi:uncharacterized protein L3040_002667 [Drepanopeziza brunnea f. sp. 'multigermtubi']|uniref:Uncharacterized protein n=1 Tax=Marssonina brunnea f. sp. multigermtubi (strain MB_m1) TaxID=1072389 RepID=K1X2K2_MARBU|nr:uncharacterized protein MBM_02693 [Drepanopeziza brunnea f. sp. 'multigermtubi' MB_m1]EKD19456.1 hypothetical protein MBM_02693 [Drepanopeziza brunnea f. sp. 'multigermtubi' MB_m1]KAJ5050797.1 hypothetical protein L3040_002667 [Drepanopeziza brunnea f. sp. 'multigermtubi']
MAPEEKNASEKAVESSVAVASSPVHRAKLRSLQAQKKKKATKALSKINNGYIRSAKRSAILGANGIIKSRYGPGGASRNPSIDYTDADFADAGIARSESTPRVEEQVRDEARILAKEHMPRAAVLAVYAAKIRPLLPPRNSVTDAKRRADSSSSSSYNNTRPSKFKKTKFRVRNSSTVKSAIFLWLHSNKNDAANDYLQSRPHLRNALEGDGFLRTVLEPDVDVKPAHYIS